MSTSSTYPLSRSIEIRHAQLRLALALLLFVVAATVPYSWLIAHFSYPAILRQPTADIMTQFNAGGSPLIWAWLCFGISALLFIPVALGFERLFALKGLSSNGSALLGTSSALAQAVGLLRWVLVVPGLSGAFASEHSSAATRDAVVVVFDAVHRYGGMVLGEFLGQLLLAAWTALAGMQMLRSGVVPRWLAVAGLWTLPLWVAGQSTLLQHVLPSVPAWDLIPAAFMAWELWLLALAVSLLVSAWKSSASLAR